MRFIKIERTKERRFTEIALIGFLVGLVEYCQRHARPVLCAALIAAGAGGYFATNNLGLVADTNKLFSPELAWQKTQTGFDQAFPLTTMQTAIVIEGKSADAVDSGTNDLTAALAKRPDLFKTVQRPDSGPFFDTHAILFLSPAELAEFSDQIAQAQPLIGPLDADPSLRGLFGVLTQAIDDVTHGGATGEALHTPFEAFAAAIRSVIAGAPQPVDWGALMAGGAAPRPEELRHFILVQPVLDFGALQPGARASAAIRAMVHDLHFGQRGLTVRLTGEVPLADEEFASVIEGAGLETSISFGLVIVLLLLGLRAPRLILAIVVTLLVGLVLTAAFAAAAVGSLNVISVAFAVLFIGIGVDFGIQFTMRFRAELFELTGGTKPNDAAVATALALSRTARTIAAPLSVAGLAIAAGFFAFLPTDYKGVSELGLIAGGGMIIALTASLTVLPAMLSLLPVRGKPEPAGFRWAAPIDARLARWAKPILSVALVIAGAALLTVERVRFDGDPLNLKDPNRESVIAARMLSKDPSGTPYRIDITASGPAEAAALRVKLEALPETRQVLTLASFIPPGQAAKLEILDQTKFLLGPPLDSAPKRTPPTETEEHESAESFITHLKTTLAGKAGAKLGKAGHELSAALDAFLAMPGGGDTAALRRTLLSGFAGPVASLRQALSADLIAADNLPAEIKEAWISADGRARIAVFPKGDMRDPQQLKSFVDAVRTVAPEATGTPVDIFEAGDTVGSAFARASTLALIAITLFLGVILRRARDVLVVLIPLLLAGLFSLATAVLAGLPFNFLNIIAVPLLLGIGVAFDIYFVMAWRASRGPVALLQTATARAVVFSALTTMTAFGSLALSPHAGTASLGEFLMISLGYVLLCTLFVQPALMTVWDRATVPAVRSRA
ncbi:MAG: hopanoid biosynthesis-associated transporter HpnN [Rhodospirillales bacterium]|nr:hopanoid biosynthesis-associated transporter HpnN [Rhodospirillales bacterium]